MRLFPSDLLNIPPNLKIYWLRKGVAHELAEGVFKGAILEQVIVCKFSTSHSRVTSSSACENPPIRYIQPSR